MKDGYYTMDKSDLYVYFRLIEETESHYQAEVTLFYKYNYGLAQGTKLTLLDKKLIAHWRPYIFGEDIQ